MHVQVAKLGGNACRHSLVRVQEFCNGSTLRDALEDGLFTLANMPKRWEPTLTILIGIAAGMAYIHSKRICHGDLNPSNVLLKVLHARLNWPTSVALHSQQHSRVLCL